MDGASVRRSGASVQNVQIVENVPSDPTVRTVVSVRSVGIAALGLSGRPSLMRRGMRKPSPSVVARMISRRMTSSTAAKRELKRANSLPRSLLTAVVLRRVKDGHRARVAGVAAGDGVPGQVAELRHLRGAIAKQPDV